MLKNNIPFKVAIGYSAVAIVLVLAISLVYSNTKSILAINQASREYIKKRENTDSTMSSLLKEEQTNLKQLSDAMAGKTTSNYLREKVKSLNTGKDSVVVHSKAPQTHEAKQTTVEVMKTKKGFFRRLADAFRKEHAETLSVKQDSNRAVIDSITTPVNVAENVADILEQIEKKEKNASQNHTENISKEMEELKMVNAKLALRNARQLNDLHQRERDSMQQAINKAIEARQHLLWQIGLLAIIATLAAIILLWYIWRDTKKERMYRENLEQANKEIQRIMNQREQLLLTITHDIKAPAASISGFIDLMNDYVSQPQGIECLNNIKTSAHHLSRLVASLLDYHQLENGLMKTNPVSFNPSQLIKDCVEGMRLQAEKKGLAMKWELANDSQNIPEAKTRKLLATENAPLFVADAFRIRQILDNLLSNAIKYTDQGSINLLAKILPAGKAYTLSVSVKDTGKGMTSEEKQKVFQAFTRLKSAQGIEGTGLGLSITKELVHLLGGNISLISTPGKGSTFSVSIPIKLSTEEKANKKGSNENIANENIANQNIANQNIANQNIANHKILILDDDQLQLQLLQEMLRRIIGNSWKVFACHQVTEALTLLHNEKPILMLMDIEMPEMSGTEMIKHINHTQMTVIAMTAHDESIKGQLLEVGFDDCLFKPFSIEKLANILGESYNPKENDDSKENKCSEESRHLAESNRFAPLLAFAEGDEEAEKEILRTIRQDLSQHLRILRDALRQNTLPIDIIGKAAHKLLPIATMMEMECLEQLKALSPEHIKEQEVAQMRRYIQDISKELELLLQ